MIGSLLNLFFAWLCWHGAKNAFEEGRNGIGWIGIIISAANAASAAANIL